MTVDVDFFPDLTTIFSCALELELHKYAMKFRRIIVMHMKNAATANKMDGRGKKYAFKSFK